MESPAFEYSYKHPYRFFLRSNYWRDSYKNRSFQYKFRHEKTMLMVGKFDSNDMSDEEHEIDDEDHEVDIKVIVLGKGRHRVLVDEVLPYDDMETPKENELLGECSDDWFQTLIAVTPCKCYYEVHDCLDQDMQIAVNRFFNTMNERHGKAWRNSKVSATTIKTNQGADYNNVVFLD
jgi:hypothetical protein